MTILSQIMLQCKPMLKEIKGAKMDSQVHIVDTNHLEKKVPNEITLLPHLMKALEELGTLL